MGDTFYAGTYTDRKAEGIYRFSFNEGKLSDPCLFVKIADPKYLCSFKDYLACVCGIADRSGIALIDRQGNIVCQVAYEDKGSCYIAANADKIYTANYHLGTVSVCEYKDGDLKHRRTQLIKDKGGCHQILFHEDYILVPSLFLDRIVIFDEELKEKGYIDFPQGSGPRHGVFSKDHHYLYVLTELSNELFKIDMDTLKIVSSVGVLPDGKRDLEGSAAIRMSEDERYIYASTRFENVLSVISADEMKLLQVRDCGDHPRDFILKDKYLLCADRFDDAVVCFKLKDGLITEEVSRLSIPDGVAILEW
ncbi:MAG: beta-propeller fold lactonase family protein [Erysipelotrichaceae bacterium]|nr:beta-propeller fold lactonase family protein [Erysipelotrichaceae bacterium]